MYHRIEIAEDGDDTFLWVFPPESIFELADRLRASLAFGPLPAVVETPACGIYQKVDCAENAFDRANGGTPLPSA